MGRKKKEETNKTEIVEKDTTKKSNPLDEAISLIEKQFGKGAIMRFTKDYILDIPTISTGSFALNEAIGVGGFPRGKIIEIYGMEGSGKTTLTLSAIAEVQKLKESAAFIDIENRFNPRWAEVNGVNLQELIFSQPKSAEAALSIVEILMDSGAVSLIVIDSVASLIPMAELEGNIGDAHIALQARLMSQALRKFTTKENKTNTTIIFLNQLRDRIGVMFGEKTITPGGKALKFYASLRIQLNRMKPIKNGETLIGNKLKARIVKNSVAPPFTEAEFNLYFDEGISKSSDIIDYAEKYGIIKKSGSWFSYNDKQLAQGKTQLRKLLREDNELFKELETKIKNHGTDIS